MYPDHIYNKLPGKFDVKEIEEGVRSRVRKQAQGTLYSIRMNKEASFKDTLNGLAISSTYL